MKDQRAHFPLIIQTGVLHIINGRQKYRNNISSSVQPFNFVLNDELIFYIILIRNWTMDSTSQIKRKPLKKSITTIKFNHIYYNIYILKQANKCTIVANKLAAISMIINT